MRVVLSGLAWVLVLMCLLVAISVLLFPDMVAGVLKILWPKPRF